MDHTSLQSLPDASRWEPKYPFDLVVTYEDTATRNQAMQLYDHLAQTLLDDYDFQCTWWRFDHFRNTSLRDQAADAAAEANMVIVCLRSGEAVPALVEQWIRTWLPRKDDRKSALVSLVGGIAPLERESCPANLFLQQVARVCKMDFFTHAFDLTRPNARVAPLTPAQEVQIEPPSNVVSVLEELFHLRTESPRWGINE